MKKKISNNNNKLPDFFSDSEKSDRAIKKSDRANIYININ